MMKYIVTAGIAILVSQLSLAEHHAAAEPKAKIVIGHEISDEGERMDITAGDLAAVELLKSYVEAHNRHDTAAIGRLNASDFKAWAANGVVIEGSDAHIAFLKDWFASSSPNWKYKYAIANDVVRPDGSVNHWVTAAYTVTNTVEGKAVKAEEMLDARIENGKIKYLFVAARALLSEE
ncbi:nuclear transport factor 2 family protein [Pseudomonadales bacterium]|jgi:hypothetical protein|nr:ester cyclase [Pseudomonadales bacterium]MDC1019351.1 nuclear transport factor 2 family protein [Pseudomonadales bacterium]|tara:strand:+ start:447 stop:980 length:534 start_codon:yes stop_codon:yes gene_type:complete